MKMKKASVFLLVFLSSFSMLAVATEVEKTNYTKSHTSTHHEKNDGQILETLIVIDNNEIHAAKVALNRSSNLHVKNFAETMVKDHSNNLKKTENLAHQDKIIPKPCEKSMALHQKGKQLLEKLETIPKHEFNLTYIHAMVKGHEEALNLINEKLLPNAKNENVIAHLKATRKTVSYHLQMAQEVQKELTSKHST